MSPLALGQMAFLGMETHADYIESQSDEVVYDQLFQ